MKRQLGISLVEILIVMAVIAILVAITATLMLPMKTKAGITACLENQRQIYMAYKLYSADHEDQAAEELGGGVYMSNLYAFHEYGISRKMLHSPRTPEHLKEKLYSTYGFSFLYWGGPVVMRDGIQGNPKDGKVKNQGMYEKLGARMPLIYSTIHDELDVYPHDPAGPPDRRQFMRPWIVGLTIHGSALKGRAEWDAMRLLYLKLKF